MIPLCTLCWGELEIPNLARTFPMKYYWILQNARVTVFTVSELLWEPPPPLPTPPPRLGLNYQTRMTFSKAFNQPIAKTFFNAETFRELLFSESISINADIFREWPPNYTNLVRVHIKPYKHLLPNNGELLPNNGRHTFFRLLLSK